MSTPPPRPAGSPGSSARRSAEPVIDWGRLWGGGFAAACVAALVGVVGLLVARGVFEVSVYVREGDGSLVTATSGFYAVAGFAAGLLATALMSALLVLRAPSPTVFFGWIVFLLTVIAAVVPFTSDIPNDSAAAAAIVNGAIGLAVWSLVAGVAAAAAGARARE